MKFKFYRKVIFANIFLLCFSIGALSVTPPPNLDEIGMAAASNDWVAVERFLLESENLSETDSLLYIFEYAIRSGQDHIIDLLLEKKALNEFNDPNAFIQIFEFALRENNFQLNGRLLEQIANLDIVSFSDLPLDEYLINAIVRISVEQSNSIDQLAYLISIGADINARTESLSSPLFASLALNNSESFWYLINNGADVEEALNHNEDLFHYSALNGDTDIISYISTFISDVNETDMLGNSALLYAVYAGNNLENSIPLLLRLGVDPCLRNDEGLNAIDMANERSSDVALEILSDISCIASR